MMLDANTLQAMRECCRDDVAFERLQTIVSNMEGKAIPLGRDCVNSQDSDRPNTAPAALHGSQEQFRLLAEKALVGIYMLQAGKFVYVNPKITEITGYSQEELIGATVLDLVVPEDRARVAENIQKRIQGEVDTIQYTLRGIRKDGVQIDFEVLGSKTDLNGEPAIIGTILDITERKRSQEALQHSEERNRAFLNAIPDLMFRIRRDGTYLDCKADKERDFAIPPSQMIGKTVYDVLPLDVAQQRMAYIEQALQTGTPQVFEYQLHHHEELRHYEARIVVSGRDEVLAIMRDITERKQAIAQLRVAAERDRLLGQIALRIRRSLDLEEILKTTVAEVRTFLGADRVFIGQIDQNWHGQVLAEAVAPGWKSILTWMTDEVYLREIWALSAQGQVQAIDDTHQAKVSPFLTDYYTQCQIQASLGVPIILNDQFTEHGAVFRVLIVNQCSHPHHWSSFEVELLSQLANQVAIAIQQAELYQQVQTFNANLERQVQERTLQLEQKMQELQALSQSQDDFLHAISHDLRTPVMGMALVLKNLQKKTGDSITLPRSILDRMVQGSDRQLQMINSLLETHSSDVQGMTLNHERVQLGQLVGAIVADLETLVNENNATLTHEIAPDLPTIHADPAFLRRVFENLITNALHHNPPGLHITLQAILQENWIHCTVQDNGVGMSQSESESLFERYAQGSRNRRSAGLGLGLYLCRQIITAHGGQIGVTSTPGAGATFWFTLPIAEV
jgi:PAS domain S-box-containing protein